MSIALTEMAKKFVSLAFVSAIAIAPLASVFGQSAPRAPIVKTAPGTTAPSEKPRWIKEPVAMPNGGQKFLQVLDARDRVPISSVMISSATSEKNVVILLVQGNNQRVIDEAKVVLKTLIREGNDRVGMVIGPGANVKKDVPAGQHERYAYIFANGDMVSTIENMDSRGDDHVVYIAVKNIYKRDIAPLFSGDGRLAPGS